MRRAWLVLALLPLVACTGILGLDDYFLADGAGGAGGAGGTGTGGGGAPPCGDGPPCDTCFKCESGACVPVAFGAPDPSGSCGGLVCDAAAHCVVPPDHVTGTGGTVRVQALRAVDVPTTWAGGMLVAGTVTGDLDFLGEKITGSSADDGFVLRVKDALDVESGAVLQGLSGTKLRLEGVGSASGGQLWAAGFANSGGTVEGANTGASSWVAVHDENGTNQPEPNVLAWLTASTEMTAAGALRDGEVIAIAGVIGDMPGLASFGQGCDAPLVGWSTGDGFVAALKDCNGFKCHCLGVGQLQPPGVEISAVAVTGNATAPVVWVAGRAPNGWFQAAMSSPNGTTSVSFVGQQIFVLELPFNNANAAPAFVASKGTGARGLPAIAAAADGGVMVGGWFDDTLELPQGASLQATGADGRDLFLARVAPPNGQLGKAVLVHHQEAGSLPGPVLDLASRPDSPARVALVGYLDGTADFGSGWRGDPKGRNLFVVEYAQDDGKLLYEAVLPVGNALDSAEVHAVYSLDPAKPLLLLATDYGADFDFPGGTVTLQSDITRGLFLASFQTAP